MTEDVITDDQVNEVAEWLESLTMYELMLLKRSYDAMVAQRMVNEVNVNVH